jgi:hypothetical protein
MLRSRLFFSPLAFLALSCATSRPYDRSTEPGGQPLPQTTAGSVILSGESLAADVTLSVLEAIQRVLPQVRVSDGPGPNRCPLVELRGKDSVMGSSNPEVYVDGTRTVDTCPLVSIQASSARRVEVYPQGVTPRPGYPNAGHGMILIFLQRAGSGGGR